MDIVGVTRLKNGKEVDEFVVGHEAHNYWYSGRPPMTHGCKDCWTAYYYAQYAQSGAKSEMVDGLESAIMHAKETIEKGEWDFTPQYDFKVEHEN